MDINVIVAFTASLVISTVSINRIIEFSKRNDLVDRPEEERKLHAVSVPNFGGIGVFLGTMFAYFAFCDYANVLRPDKLFSISILLFFFGLKDDIEPVASWKRLLLEFFCAFFIIYVTNVRIITMYGIFGIFHLPYAASFVLTSIFIVACINAYNMIDGIDGLLGSISLVGVIVAGFIFNGANEWLWTLFCVALSGSLVGFLVFNWSPAKIFMGNGGSMLMGTLFSCIALRLMQLPPVHTPYFTIVAPHVIVVGIVAIPIFDMLAVIVTRLVKGASPFKADRRHTHHRLLGLGLNHAQATSVLVVLNLVILSFAYYIQTAGALRALVWTLLVCSFFSVLLILISRRFGKEKF